MTVQVNVQLRRSNKRSNERSVERSSSIDRSNERSRDRSNERTLDRSHKRNIAVQMTYTCMLCAHAQALEFEWARTFTRMVMKGFVNVRLSDLVNVQNNVGLNVYLIAQLNFQLNVHLNGQDDAKARSSCPIFDHFWLSIFLRPCK